MAADRQEARTWDATCTLHDWESARSQLQFIYDDVLPPGSSRGTYHRDGAYSAWLVRRGRASITIDAKTTEAGPGQWLICFAPELSQTFSDDVRLLSLRVEGSWPNGELMFGGADVLVFPAKRYPQLERMAKRLLDDIGKVDWRQVHPAFSFHWRTRMTYRAHLQYQRHLLGWSDALCGVLQNEGLQLQIRRESDLRLAHALYVLDHVELSDPFPRKEVMQVSSLTLGQLNRRCTHAYGMTLYRYWELRRIQAARRLLEEPGRSVKRTALQLGFAQLSYFSVWFRRHTGRTPSAYKVSAGVSFNAAKPSG